MVALEDTPLETTQRERLEFPVDVEHSGIRAAGCGSFVGGAILSFFLLNAITNAAIITALGSLALGALIANLADRLLKKTWPSGRALVIDKDAITIEKRGTVEREIKTQESANVLAWRFEVPRSGRVRKGWYVLGLGLEQDGDHLAVYTFVSPNAYEDMQHSDQFTLLDRRQERKRKTESIREMRAAGESRRLLEAEAERGLNGAELTYESFIAYLEIVQSKYPQSRTIS